MINPQILSDKQIGRFKKNGYLVVPALLGADEIQQVCAWTNEVANYPEVLGKYMVYFEQSLTDPSKRILSRIENFVPYHQGFASLVGEPRMLQAVSELFGEPAVLFKDKISFGLPDSDGFKAHQDVQAGWDAYASMHITTMVAVDHTTAENGSLELVPGQHNKGLLGRMWEPLTMSNTQRMQFVAIDADPGDAVFFDSFAPHRSTPNKSKNPRRILYITYNRLLEGDHRKWYYADKRKRYPPDCERVGGKTYRYRI